MVVLAGTDTLAVLLPHHLLTCGNHVEPKWAGVPVNKVDSLDVKAWATSLTRNGSSATVVNRAVGILAGILDDAVEHRALAFNPARRFKRGEKPTKSPKRHVYLTEGMCAGWPRSPAVTPTWC